jgi:hypothetical protein
MKKQLSILLLILLSGSNFLFSQETIIHYLSGTGADKTENWKFFCSEGMNSGAWTTIEVPSCWEQQGFGSYNYGHAPFEQRLNETGLYRHDFEVTASWKGKQVEIVFEGVMTDALVKINGKQAGPVHQGAFYPFRYDISNLLIYGTSNQLEVLVKKHSDNESVNQAERQADYWIFGGIFRPVYLEIKPEENIWRVAIDAKADGSFRADVFTSEIKNAVWVKTEIQTLEDEWIAEFTTETSRERTRVTGKAENPATWSPEFPHRYKAVFSLLDKNGKTIHRYSERFGFRTVEVREADGIYVNGTKIKMKGVNRHTFHPKYGRTSSKAISIEVVNLIKDMNMNAVRMSHYPPDRHFLDVCDSLGLFVLDELAGWQKPSYDDVVGRKLLEEMIARDVNHPSVILWDNANEGGENITLDDDFFELDIQKREVLHPWGDFRKTNTRHYIPYNYLSHDGFSRRKIFLPTEFLHGLYDGGHGAGLEDYWQRMWDDPLCAGGFLWVFADESVERIDRNRELDSDGNHAPDGILGPYHEKEGSFYTIKEIWAPVFFEKRILTKNFDGTFRIQNRFVYTDLNQCRFEAEWGQLPFEGEETFLSQENLDVNLAPGQYGTMQLRLPPGWQKADILRITATDPHGRHIYTWTWPVKTAKEKASETTSPPLSLKPELTETQDAFVVKAGGLEYSFNMKNGTINSVRNKGILIPLSNGPLFVRQDKEIEEIVAKTLKDTVFITTQFKNGDTFLWAVLPNGLLRLDVSYEPGWNCRFAGITFDYPEEKIAGMKWLGNGPCRVYKNRMKGAEFGLWEKAYNNTITGESEFVYPEFKGYHANVYQAEIKGKNTLGFKVSIGSNDIFLRMLTPKEPTAPANTTMEYPKGDISFLHGINAIGTKFSKPEILGPQSSPYHFISNRMYQGKLKMKLTFDFN